MTARNKIIAGWLAFLFVVFHCSFIFIYAFPSNRISPSLKKLVTPYVEPMFEQQWSMFAPCPVLNGGISMKFISKSDTTDWLRPAEQAVFWHRWLRITHHAEIALLESNLIYWISADITDLNLSLNEPIPEDKVRFFKDGYSYNLLARYALGISRNEKIDDVQSCLMKCDLENVETGEMGELLIPEINLNWNE